MTRSLFWIGVAAVALAAAWLVIVPIFRDVRFEAENPWAIGNSEDAFAYAGEDVHTISGTAILRIDPDMDSGDWGVADLFTIFGGAAPTVTAWWIRVRLDSKTAVAVWRGYLHENPGLRSPQ